jgi:hypothetical protein
MALTLRLMSNSSTIHDEALSISDAIDRAYGEHVAGKDAEIERLRARSTKFEQLLSEALRQGWLDESKTSPFWLQEALTAVAKWVKEQANFAVDIRTCGKPELHALNYWTNDQIETAKRELIRTEMCCATFLSLPLLDSDEHSPTVDISDLQADRLRDAQSGGVAGRKDRAMLDAPHTSQKLQNFFLSKDDRQLLRFFGCWNYFFQVPSPMECDFLKETKSRDGDDNRAWSELPFVAAKDRDFVGAIIRNGISHDLDAAWCLSIERKRIAIYGCAVSDPTHASDEKTATKVRARKRSEKVKRARVI